jgi:hypothetical protein
MSERSADLQSFVDAAFAAMDDFVDAPAARHSIDRIFAALGRPGQCRRGPGKRLPVCAHLDAALATPMPAPSLTRLIERFREIEPQLEWRRRAYYDETASENFPDSHANAMIIGPGGLEPRNDAWLGVSLLAPHVRYPDHNHPPEETYLVLSQGEFRQADGGWFSPGAGGSFHNVPGIRHAMRSGDTPLFALWALLA